MRREIVKGWNANKGVVAIRVHKLLDSEGKASAAGTNPLDKITYRTSGKLSDVAPIYSPSGNDSKAAYASIKDNIEDWIEAAIAIRSAN